MDKFLVKVDGVAEALVYTRTYDGGDIEDYLLIDNTAGAAPKVVTLVAHNADLATAHKAAATCSSKTSPTAKHRETMAPLTYFTKSYFWNALGVVSCRT